MRKSDFALLMTTMVCTTAVNANPLTEGASDVAECRELSNPTVRLACYDAAAELLARALESSELSAAASAGSASSSESASSTSSQSSSAQGSKQQAAASGRISDRADTPGDRENDTPEWAAAPSRAEEDRSEQPNNFTATIVRITKNNLGRHYFHTDDGAVWMQTQIERIREPRSLPAQAEFQKKLTGNPTIKFDISNRSYRVRRVE